MVVEGVEDEADLAFLRHIRARYGQGYYLGKPMFAEEYMSKEKGNSLQLHG